MMQRQAVVAAPVSVKLRNSGVVHSRTAHAQPLETT